MTRHCIFKNLYLQDGNLYYLYNNTAPKDFPLARLWEFYTKPKVAHDNHAADVDSIIIPETIENFRRIIKERREEGLNPDLEEYDAGITIHIQHYRNWWHCMDDSANLFLRYCKYFGICTYDRTTKIAALLFANLDINHSNMYPSARELFKCFGEAFHIKENRSSGYGEHFPFKVYHFQQVALGVGDEVWHPYLAPDMKMNTANQTIREWHIDYLRECTGLPKKPLPKGLAHVPSDKVQPKVVLSNRPYVDGRSILGLDQLYYKLKDDIPNLEIRYILGETLQSQIKDFDDVDVLLIPHGAATANLIFLPPGAVVVEVSAFGAHTFHDEAISKSMEFLDLTFMHLDCAGRIEPILPKLTSLTRGDLAAFQSASTEDQMTVIEYQGQWPEPQPIYTLFGGPHEMFYFFNYRPDIAEAKTVVMQAVALWRQKKSSSKIEKL